MVEERNDGWAIFTISVPFALSSMAFASHNAAKSASPEEIGVVDVTTGLNGIMERSMPNLRYIPFSIPT